jgi:peptidoglycan/LPS O-acetylase OafA/YrhL
LERKDSSNFFAVFYVRRLCRTFPSYILITCLIFLMFALVDRPPEWMQYKPGFSIWSYLTFTQNFQMAFTNEVGPYWLAPYWTLSVEEHFYLIGPAFLVFAPKRWLLPILGVFAVLAVVFRYVAAVYWPEPIIADAILPGRMDTLILGIFAAILVVRNKLQWEKYDFALRVLPLVAMVGVMLLHIANPEMNKIFGHFILGVGAACFILMIVRDLPEAQKLKSKFLCFCAEISYATYLTHIAVLGLMHGLFLGTKPDIDTPAKFVVTALALPVAFATGWVITRFFEAPFNAYGRSWKWKA